MLQRLGNGALVRYRRVNFLEKWSREALQVYVDVISWHLINQPCFEMQYDYPSMLYWNKWGQFPKGIETFIGEKELIMTDSQIASVIDLC